MTDKKTSVKEQTGHSSRHADSEYPIIDIPRISSLDIDLCDPLELFPALPWHTLTEVGERFSNYRTRAQLAYCESSLYVVVDCEDVILSGTGLPDFADLYTEDVVEVFLWTDERYPLYFEYEVSPFNAELPLLIPNQEGDFMGWLPWHYTEERQVKRKLQIQGGEQLPGAKVSGWTVALSIPFALLKGLGNVPPYPGMSWRGNITRMDYDDLPRAQWSLSPGTCGEFHRFTEFAVFRFGNAA